MATVKVSQHDRWVAECLAAADALATAVEARLAHGNRYVLDGSDGEGERVRDWFQRGYELDDAATAALTRYRAARGGR